MFAMSEMPFIPNAGSIHLADLTGDAVVRMATVADVLVGIVSAHDLLGVYAADADQL